MCVFLMLMLLTRLSLLQLMVKSDGTKIVIKLISNLSKIGSIPFQKVVVLSLYKLPIKMGLEEKSEVFSSSPYLFIISF